MSWRPPDPDPEEPFRRPGESEPRPETSAAGNLLLWFWGSLVVFGGFLVMVPGADLRARVWLWVGLVLVVPGVVGLMTAGWARVRYLRGARGR